nr:JmjC domain-containing protein [Tanacetum cinerariifolium]
TLDAGLSLSQSKVRDRASKIIYKRLKKQRSSSNTALPDATIPTVDPDSAVRVDSADDLVSSGADSVVRVDSTGDLVSAGADYANHVVSAGAADSTGTFISTGTSVDAGPSVPAATSSPIRDPAKGKAIATPSSPVPAPSAKELADQQAAILKAERQELLEQELKQSLDAEQIYLDNLLAQRVAEEQERESKIFAAQSTQRQAELDRIALNLTNKEWIGLVDQVRDNQNLSAELLGADVSEDTFSTRMVDLMNQRRKVIAEMKAKAKRDKPMTPAQQREYMRTFVKNQSTTIYTIGVVDFNNAKAHHHYSKRSGDTLESSKSKKLKSSPSVEQPAELQKTPSVSAGSTIAAGAPNSAVPSVSAVLSDSVVSLVPADTPIAVGVPTATAAFGSTEPTVPLRKSSKKKSIARKRTLPSPSKLESTTLPFDEDDPEAEFKKYLRQISDDDEPTEPVSLALVSDVCIWEIIPTEFGLGEIHVITRADGAVKRFYTLRNLMHWDQWEIRSWRFYPLPAIHVLETEAGDIIYMFVDKKYPILPATIQRMLNHGLKIDRDPFGNDLTTAIQLIRSLLNQLPPAP